MHVCDGGLKGRGVSAAGLSWWGVEEGRGEGIFLRHHGLLKEL